MNRRRDLLSPDSRTMRAWRWLNEIWVRAEAEEDEAQVDAAQSPGEGGVVAPAQEEMRGEPPRKARRRKAQGVGERPKLHPSDASIAWVNTAASTAGRMIIGHLNARTSPTNNKPSCT